MKNLKEYPLSIHPYCNRDTKMPAGYLVGDIGIGQDKMLLCQVSYSEKPAGYPCLKTLGEAEAFASLVIKSVNSHQKLVDALEKISNSPTPFNQRELESWRESALQIAQETLNEITK